MNALVYQFLDDLGTQEFINVIQELIDQDVQDTVLDTIDEDAFNSDRALSIACTLEYIQRITTLIDEVKNDIDEVNPKISELHNDVGLNRLNIALVTGNINVEVPDPDRSTIYLQHDDPSDITWAIYIWDGAKWMVVGETKYDLANYWSKEETDEFIAKFYEIAMDTMSDDYLKSRANTIFNEVMNR